MKREGGRERREKEEAAAAKGKGEEPGDQEELPGFLFMISPWRSHSTTSTTPC